MSTLKANQWLNPDGSENYKCRAWVNFNGTGVVAIRAAGNVSSITDNGVGDYTVNFTTPIPDADYAVSFGSGDSSGWSRRTADEATARTTSAVRLYVANTTFSLADSANIDVSIFR